MYEHLYNLEFKQFIRFIAVAEQGTLAQAAEILNMFPGNLGNNIKQLERELRVQLFDRNNGMQLTETGKIFRDQVYLIFNQTSQAIDMTRQAERGKIGRLSIGFNSSASNTVLPNILSDFRSAFPNIELENMICSTANNLINELKKCTIDVILIHWSAQYYESQEDVEIMTLKEEPLIVVLPQHHPLASQPKISLQALKKERFILPPSTLNYSLYKPITMYCEKELGFRPNQTHEATLMLTIINLVAGGAGVSILPDNARLIQHPAVVYRDIKDPIPPVEIVAAWRRDNTSKTLENFVNVLRKLRK